MQNNLQKETQKINQTEEFNRFENVTEILRMIVINEQIKDKQLLRNRAGSLCGHQVTFEGQISPDTYFTGKEISNDNTRRYDYKLFACLFNHSNGEKEKGNPLCNIYRRWDLCTNKVRSYTKESIVIKTPKANQGQHVVTRINGSPVTGGGILYVVHAPEENANVFIDQLCSSVLHENCKVFTSKKLCRLNVDREMISNFDKNFMEDHDSGYQLG